MCLYDGWIISASSHYVRPAPCPEILIIKYLKHDNSLTPVHPLPTCSSRDTHTIYQAMYGSNIGLFETVDLTRMKMACLGGTSSRSHDTHMPTEGAADHARVSSCRGRFIRFQHAKFEHSNITRTVDLVQKVIRRFRKSV